MTPRYTVCCFGRLDSASPIGSLDVTQSFTSRRKAERFARAISHYLPGHPVGSPGSPLAWVLVSALAVNGRVALEYGRAHCYLSYDRGAVQVKRHEINSGYHGQQR